MWYQTTSAHTHTPQRAAVILMSYRYTIWSISKQTRSNSILYQSISFFSCLSICPMIALGIDEGGRIWQRGMWWTRLKGLIWQHVSEMPQAWSRETDTWWIRYFGRTYTREMQSSQSSFRQMKTVVLKHTLVIFHF